jgi:hypothetical protein
VEAIKMLANKSIFFTSEIVSWERENIRISGAEILVFPTNLFTHECLQTKKPVILNQ